MRAWHCVLFVIQFSVAFSALLIGIFLIVITVVVPPLLSNFPKTAKPTNLDVLYKFCAFATLATSFCGLVNVYSFLPFVVMQTFPMSPWLKCKFRADIFRIVYHQQPIEEFRPPTQMLFIPLNVPKVSRRRAPPPQPQSGKKDTPGSREITLESSPKVFIGGSKADYPHSKRAITLKLRAHRRSNRMRKKRPVSPSKEQIVLRLPKALKRRSLLLRFSKEHLNDLVKKGKSEADKTEEVSITAHEDFTRSPDSSMSDTKVSIGITRRRKFKGRKERQSLQKPKSILKPRGKNKANTCQSKKPCSEANLSGKQEPKKPHSAKNLLEKNGKGSNKPRSQGEKHRQRKFKRKPSPHEKVKQSHTTGKNHENKMVSRRDKKNNLRSPKTVKRRNKIDEMLDELTKDKNFQKRLQRVKISRRRTKRNKIDVNVDSPDYFLLRLTAGDIIKHLANESDKEAVFKLFPDHSQILRKKLRENSCQKCSRNKAACRNRSCDLSTSSRTFGMSFSRGLHRLLDHRDVKAACNCDAIRHYPCCGGDKCLKNQCDLSTQPPGNINPVVLSLGSSSVFAKKSKVSKEPSSPASNQVEKKTAKKKRSVKISQKTKKRTPVDTKTTPLPPKTQHEPSTRTNKLSGEKSNLNLTSGSSSSHVQHLKKPNHRCSIERRKCGIPFVHSQSKLNDQVQIIKHPFGTKPSSSSSSSSSSSTSSSFSHSHKMFVGPSDPNCPLMEPAPFLPLDEKHLAKDFFVPNEMGNLSHTSATKSESNYSTGSQTSSSHVQHLLRNKSKARSRRDSLHARKAMAKAIAKKKMKSRCSHGWSPSHSTSLCNRCHGRHCSRAHSHNPFCGHYPAYAFPRRNSCRSCFWPSFASSFNRCQRSPSRAPVYQFRSSRPSYASSIWQSMFPPQKPIYGYDADN